MELAPSGNLYQMLMAMPVPPVSFGQCGWVGGACRGGGRGGARGGGLSCRSMCPRVVPSSIYLLMELAPSGNLYQMLMAMPVPSMSVFDSVFFGGRCKGGGGRGRRSMRGGEIEGFGVPFREPLPDGPPLLPA
jgi:hypothetical protein